MQAPFIHLRTHSEFSLSDGLLRVKELVGDTATAGLPAVALTDRSNLYALIKFQKAAFAAGVKPVFGADLLWLDDVESKPATLTLLVQNQQGYKNLVALISLAYTRGQGPQGSTLRSDWIAEHAEGLIALSGARDGDVGRALLGSTPELAEQHAAHWRTIFGDRYYIDLQRLGRDEDERYVAAAVALAEKMQLPVVATNGVCFRKREDFEAHEVRVCINDSRTLDDPRRQRKYSEQQYLKSAAEMQVLFDDIPEALANSVAIAERCSAQVELGKYYLPEYPIPEGKTQDSYFRELAHDGLQQRLAVLFDPAAEDFAQIAERYRQRLDFEVDTILQMGFPGYFLIVMDFIRWAKQNDIPVGPGRGSGAGSLVAYALEITDLDPLAYDLLFERFLNPERVSMPDFDVDFCMERRDRVIHYVAETYGREAVGQIITFGTMAAKAVVRDVARAQGKPFALGDKLSKAIPFEVGMTLEKAFEQEESLRQLLEEDAEAQEIWDMALQLEGTTRNVGKHAGGVVIAPSRLTDFSPLYCDEQGQGLVTQYDKNDVEDAGLVKFDFLGLRTLTIIDWALAIANRSRAAAGEAPLAIDQLPLDDADTYAMLQEANTTAVFQLESRGMKDLIKRLKPDTFEDIIALVALFRPGPLQSGMVDDFINRKQGRAELAYPHPRYQHECLQPILEPTYGIILYQEQVMQIAQAMSGYSLGEADLLRRAMGKKKPEEMAKQGKRFIEGAIARGHDEELAKNIFDLMEKFAGYGFNKSHSAAYALVSYQTAWLKRHYPAEFMAAVLSSEMQNTDKIVTLLEECRNLGVAFTPPDVNCGEYLFSVDAEGRVVYGLGAIKGLGEGPVETILAARAAGQFSDLFDFCRRTDSRKLNKRALEALVRCGAFDSLGVPRWVLMVSLPEAMRAAEQQAANESAGIDDLFGALESQGQKDVYASARGTRPWLLQKLLNAEKETLGLFLSGHPIDSYESELKCLVKRRLREVQPQRGKQTVAGMIVAMRTMKTKKGDSMAFLSLDDRTGRIEVTVYARVFQQLRDLLVKDAIVLVEGTVARDDYSGGLAIRADNVQSLADARQQRASAIQLRLSAAKLDSAFIVALQQLLRSHIDQYGAGGCAIEIHYRGESARSKLAMGEQWRVMANDALLNQLRELCGERAVDIDYGRSQPAGFAAAPAAAGVQAL